MPDNKLECTDEFLSKLKGLIPNENCRTIMIVDDVRANVFLIESILSDEFNVLTASRAAEMWSYLKHKTVDLILLDLMMPYENGFDVLEKMKNDPELKKIPVIVVTAKDTKDDVIKVFSLGAVDYITKPVKAEVLVSKIHKILKIDDSGADQPG